MKRKTIAIIFAALLAFSAASCGTVAEAPAGAGAAAGTEQAADQSAAQAAASTAETGSKILKAASSFAYPSLDVHKEYYGWYTSIYGISEALFQMDENSEVD